NVSPAGTVLLSMCLAVGFTDSLQLLERLCSNEPPHFTSVENPPIETVQLLFQESPCFFRFSDARSSTQLPWGPRSSLSPGGCRMLPALSRLFCSFSYLWRVRVSCRAG